MTQRHHDKKQQELLCKKYLSGKLGRRAFCEAHDISAKTLSRWLSKPKDTLESKLNFIPIGAMTNKQLPGIEVDLPNGTKLKLYLEAAAISDFIMELLCR